MSNKIKVWCTEGVLTCKNTNLKFTDQGIMLENSDEDIFIPYGSLQLVRRTKGKGRNSNIRLRRINPEKQDYVDQYPLDEGEGACC